MQPNYLPLTKIFGADRHIVPLFQRPYVWDKDENWEPLWEDFSGLCDRLLATPEGPVRGHFLGTLVLQQVPHKSGGVSTREIVDGQQRLTTLQILCQAIRHALLETEAKATSAGDEVGAKAARIAAGRINSMIKNQDYSDDEEQYKVWPTNEDRAPFQQVMDADGPAALAEVQTRMAGAYRFFLDEVRRWLALGPASERANAISTALREQVRMIVLDLDNTDEPQAIFETLNAHGTPLLPADLVKNWLLWDAARTKAPLEALYKAHWHPFDKEHAFWREEVGTGHARRARIDTFLQNWLTMRCREAIPAKHLYDRFVRQMENERRDGVAGCDVASLMANISAGGARFRALVEPTGKTRFDVFLRRLSSMALVIFHPFLLAVMARDDIKADGRDRIAAMMESYLVRRMICDLETRGYNALCLALIGALSGPEANDPETAIRGVLSTTGSKVIHWPSDAEFGERWKGRQFYGSLRRERVAMILQAIEMKLQTDNVKGEPVVHFDYDKLQVEHVMPQSWREHWPVENETAARVRESRINMIGNLTLVSDKLNPSLSNASWLGAGAKGKRAALDGFSMLRMNARLVKENPETWSEATIDARTDSLFQVAKCIWPSAEPVA